MNRLGWRLGLFLGLAFLVFFPAIHGDFVWDDDAYIVDNMTLRSLSGLWQIWSQPGQLVQYYPLTFTSFWLEYHLWHLNPVGYHIVNVLLQALNGFLLWRLLERFKVRGALLASLIFMIHPVQVESVAWITERKNLLSAFFYFTALLSYFRYRENDKKIAWYLISYFLLLAAVLSKTVTGTFTAAVLFLLWWKKERILKDFIRLIPFFITSVALAAITIYCENQHVLSIGRDKWLLSLDERFLIAGRALWFYLGKLIWPHPLLFTYPRWEIDAGALWQWLFPLSFLSFLAILWGFRSKWGRGPFAAFALFAATLFPALGFRNFFPMRFSFVADHFQYLAMIGPVTFAVSTASITFKNHIRVKAVFAITLLVIYAVLSWRQCSIYESREILWRDTLSKNPNVWIAHNNLGVELMRLGQKDEAESHFKESIRLRPDLAEAHNNLGGLMLAQGREEEALRHYREAVRHRPKSETFHKNLASTLLGRGEINEAMEHFQKAAELENASTNPRFNFRSLLSYDFDDSAR